MLYVLSFLVLMVPIAAYLYYDNWRFQKDEEARKAGGPGAIADRPPCMRCGGTAHLQTYLCWAAKGRGIERRGLSFVTRATAISAAPSSAS